MQVTTATDKMKEWIAAYIRDYRAEGYIGIHVVDSKFNEHFEATFNIDHQTIVCLLIREGFLKARPAKVGFSIWLSEDLVKSGEQVCLNPKQNQESPVVPAQSGENQMKTSETNIEHTYAFEFVPHPETNEVNILELIRYIIRKLGEKIPSEPEMDGGYAVVKLNLFPTLLEMGLPREKFDDISRIMQEMALVRKYSRLGWGILPEKAAADFMTASLYNIAKEAMKWRDKRNYDVSSLRQKLQKTSKPWPNPAESIGVTVPHSIAAEISFESEAIEALAQAERLSDELAQTLMKLKAVEAELKNRPDQTEAMRKVLRERLSALNKDRTS